MAQYLFWLIPFFVSFATASGDLNNNFYIKLFAFEFAFILMFVYNAYKKERNFRIAFSISYPDVLIIGLLIIYFYFYAGYCNIIDHSVSLIYLLFYFFIRSNFDNKSVDALIKIVPLIIASRLLICLLQYFRIIPNYSIYFEVGSTFGNPDMLSAYLAVLLPFCYTGNRKWIFFQVSIVGLTVFLFFYLQARTAIVTTAIVLLLYYARTRHIHKMYIILGISVLVIGVAFLIYWHEISVLGRLYIWIVSLAMFVSKPLGWGPYAFDKYYPEYQSVFTTEHPELANALNYDIVHSSYNEFLNIAVTIGLIGLILYVLFVAYILKTSYKTKSLLFFPLCAFQIVSLSYFPFKIIPLTIVYVICCSIVVSTNNVYKIHLVGSGIRGKFFASCIIIPVLFCFLFSMLSFNYWEKAVKQSREIETYNEACESFNCGYPFLKDNGRFLISFAELKYKMNRDSTLLLMEQAAKCFSDVAFCNNLAIIYEDVGRIDDAKMKYKIAVNMSHSNIDIYYAQMQFLQRIGDVDEAYQVAVLLAKKIGNTPSRVEHKLILERVNKLISSYSVVRKAFP